MIKLRSQRLQEELHPKGSDPYVYDYIPREFRVQVTYIWEDAWGKYGSTFEEPLYGCYYWDYLCHEMKRALGVYSLVKNNPIHSQSECKSFILNCSDEHYLDIIELSFKMIHFDYMKEHFSKERIKMMHEELNNRFEQHNLGYEFVEGSIIRKDNKVTHELIVKEAIKLLHEKRFFGPSDEFMNGLAHYRDGKYKEAINDAHKAFESTMKVICNIKEISYTEKDNAKTLLDYLYKNKIISEQLQSHFTGLRATLESGLPVDRNKNSSHGQGADVVPVSKELAQYALNLSATNIVFLVNTL